MLAPQRKLWTTPEAAVAQGLRLLDLSKHDTLADFGCGDGRVLMSAAQEYGCSCIGVEVNEARAAETEKAVKEAGLQESISIRCMNALEAGEAAVIAPDACGLMQAKPCSTADLGEPSAVFLFLIERGLKRFVPLLLDEAARRRARGGDAQAEHGTAQVALTVPSAAAAESEPCECARAAEMKGSDAPVLRMVSVLYRVPAGVCCAPHSVAWATSSALVKTPVYLYHFFGDERDTAS